MANDAVENLDSQLIEYLDALVDDSSLEITSFEALEEHILSSKDSPFQQFPDAKARLYETLNKLTSGFGYQARLPECAHDVAPSDIEVDENLKRLLKQNGSPGTYKISGEGDLSQVLTKIPSAFISAGLNPQQVDELKSIEEKLANNPGDDKQNLEDRKKELLKIQADNYESLKKDLAESEFKVVEVDGNYGGEEKSFMVVLNHKLKAGTFKEFLSRPDVKKLMEWGKKYNQDSVLFQWGAAQFYYYPASNKISFGEGYNIYDLTTTPKEKLPDAYYSEIHKYNDKGEPEGRLRFQLNLDFDHKYSANLFGILCDYTRRQFFKDYSLGKAEPAPKPVAQEKNKRRSVVIMRGVNNYNDAAKQLQQDLKAKGISAAIVGSDAHLHHLERQGVKGFRENLLPKMQQSNKNAFNTLLNDGEPEVIIFADMNKKLEQVDSYVKDVLDAGIDKDNIILWNVHHRNMEDPNQKCHYSHTVRHDKEKEKIDEKEIKVGDLMMPQLNDTHEVNNLDLIVKKCADPLPNRVQSVEHYKNILIDTDLEPDDIAALLVFFGSLKGKKDYPNITIVAGASTKPQLKKLQAEAMIAHLKETGVIPAAANINVVKGSPTDKEHPILIPIPQEQINAAKIETAPSVEGIETIAQFLDNKDSSLYIGLRNYSDLRDAFKARSNITHENPSKAHFAGYLSFNVMSMGDDPNQFTHNVLGRFSQKFCYDNLNSSDKVNADKKGASYNSTTEVWPNFQPFLLQNPSLLYAAQTWDESNIRRCIDALSNPSCLGITSKEAKELNRYLTGLIGKKVTSLELSEGFLSICPALRSKLEEGSYVERIADEQCKAGKQPNLSESLKEALRVYQSYTRYMWPLSSMLCKYPQICLADVVFMSTLVNKDAMKPSSGICQDKSLAYNGRLSALSEANPHHTESNVTFAILNDDQLKQRGVEAQNYIAGTSLPEIPEHLKPMTEKQEQKFCFFR